MIISYTQVDLKSLYTKNSLIHLPWSCGKQCSECPPADTLVYLFLGNIGIYFTVEEHILTCVDKLYTYNSLRFDEHFQIINCDKIVQITEIFIKPQRKTQV